MSELSWSDVPEATRHKALLVLLDGVAAGLWGALLPWSRRAIDGLSRLGTEGRAAIWSHGQRTSVEHAAMLNSSFVQGFELDDVHEFGPIHSAATVVPPIFAWVDSADQSGDVRDILAALAAGLEVGPRIGVAIGGYDLLSRGWHCGSVYGTLAAAAACSRLAGLDARETEDALGIAATQSSGLMAAQFEAMVKRMHHGFASRAGLVAAALAGSGYTGIRGVLEREYGGFGSVFAPGQDVDWNAMVDGLGRSWEIDRIAFKAYACNAGAHPALDGVVSWLRDETLDAESMASLEITLPDVPYQRVGWPASRPLTVIGAQMNVGYAVAACIVTGDPVVHSFLPQHLDDPTIWDLVDRIHVRSDPRWQRQVDRQRTPRATRLRLTTVDGQSHEKVVPAARGMPSHPMTADEVRSKAVTLLSLATGDPSTAEDVAGMVLSLESMGELRRLLETLAQDRTEMSAQLGF